MEVPTISVASCWEPNANAMLLTILPLPSELTPRRRISSFWKQLCEGHNENCFNVQNVLNGFRRFIKIHPLSNLDKLCHLHKHRHCLFWVVDPSAQRKVPSPSCFWQSEARSLWKTQDFTDNLGCTCLIYIMQPTQSLRSFMYWPDRFQQAASNPITILLSNSLLHSLIGFPRIMGDRWAKVISSPFNLCLGKMFHSLNDWMNCHSMPS